MGIKDAIVPRIKELCKQKGINQAYGTRTRCGLKMEILHNTAENSANIRPYYS